MAIEEFDLVAPIAALVAHRLMVCTLDQSRGSIACDARIIVVILRSAIPDELELGDGGIIPTTYLLAIQKNYVAPSVVGYCALLNLGNGKTHSFQTVKLVRKLPVVSFTESFHLETSNGRPLTINDVPVYAPVHQCMHTCTHPHTYPHPR
jgi:hypothetical protein